MKDSKKQEVNFDVASQASSRRSRASGVGVDVANSSKQLVFSEPSATVWMTKYFPIFPVLLPLKSASLQLLSLLGLFIFTMQHWGFVLNPHFSPQWGAILGNEISKMFYGFQFTVYDPVLVPFSNPNVLIALDYIALAIGGVLIGCILFHLRAKDDAAAEAKTPTGTVARVILNITSGPLLIPITMMSFSSLVCNGNGSMWMYPGQADGKCWGGHHIAAFIPGVLNLFIYLPLTYIKTVCVYEYYALSDNFLARRHSFLDKICFFADFANCFIFAICLAFDVPAAFAALHCIFSAVLVFLYMFLLPYYNMFINRFYVFVHSMECLASLFVAVSLANYSFNSSEITSVLFLGFGLLIAVCLVLLTDFRVNPIFALELQKAASCVELTAQQAAMAQQKQENNEEEEDEENEIFNVDDEEVRRLPYPKGLASSMDFSPYIALNTQVVESISREALNHSLLDGGKGHEQHTAYSIVVPYIRHCYTCFDPCLAVGYLDVYARRFGIGQVGEMMLLFAANIYGRAQCTFIREPYVLLAFTSFITAYLPGLRFMGVDLLKLALHNRCSIEEQFRALKQANDLRASLGIRTHAHSIRSTKARATHGKILQLMNRFWVKLTEPSVNIKEVADVADSIRSHRRSAIDQFDAALVQQQSVDPLLLRRLGDFFSQVLMAPDAAQECYSEARDIYEMRQARSMRGTRQHTAEVDVASLTERMRQLLHFHSVGGGVLTSKASASSIIQVFSTTLVVLFTLLAVACSLQVYLVSTMSSSINRILLNIYYTRSLWTSSLRLSGSVLSLGWAGAASSFNERLVVRLQTLISQFLLGFRYVSSYGSNTKTNAAKTHLMTLFTIPYYNNMADNTAGFSLWGLSEDFLQAIDRYMNESNPISGITATNFNELFVIDSAGVLASGYELYLNLETNDQMDRVSTVWMSLFLVIFIVNALLLAVAYASIIFVFERTSLSRVFTFQLFTLIPYDSLEKLATEAKERYHQIHMEKSLGKTGNAASGAPREVTRHDEGVRKESIDNKNHTVLPYLGDKEMKLVSCLKKTELSPSPTRKTGTTKKAVSFNPVVEVVRSSSEKDKKSNKKVEKESDAASSTEAPKPKKKKAATTNKEEDSSAAIKWVVAFFGVILLSTVIAAIVLGFSISSTVVYRRNMNSFITYEELLNACILDVPRSIQAAVRFMVTGSPVFFQESQDYIVNAINSIPRMMGINLPLTSTPLLVYMHKVSKEMDNATIDACVLASHTYGVSLGHWGAASARAALTEDELVAELKVKYPLDYTKAEKISAVAQTTMPLNLIFSFVILMEHTLNPLTEFLDRLLIVYGEMCDYQLTRVKQSPLFIVALVAVSCGAGFSLFIMLPMRRHIRRYVSPVHAFLIFLSYGGVFGLCIYLLVKGKEINTQYKPNADALLTLSTFMGQTLMNHLLVQGFVLCASPYFWFASLVHPPYAISKVISAFIIENYLTELVVTLFQASSSYLWDLEVMGNVSASLAVSALDTAMVIEPPMAAALKYAHWDITAQPNYEYNQVWNKEEHYYTTNAADLALTKDKQYQIAFTVVTGSEFYTTFENLVGTWRELQVVFVNGEREATEKSISHRTTLIYLALGFCALPIAALIFIGTKLGKALNESFNTNSGSKNTSTDHFKYQAMLRRGLYGLMMLSIFYAATFGMGMWLTQTGYAFSRQLIIEARREADVALTVFNLRKVISDAMTYTTSSSIISRNDAIYTLINEQFNGMSDRGVPIGLLASDELDKLTFGLTGQTYMTRLMNSFFMDKCSRNIMGTGPLPNESNYISIEGLPTTVGGGLTDWVTYMSRSIATIDRTDSTLEDISAVMLPLSELGYELLAASENTTTTLLNAFTLKNDSYMDIILALSIVALVMTILVFFAIGVPTIYRLFDEEGAVRTLLQIIPPNIRDEVPAIQQHVETGKISGSSELHRKFEQNEKLLQNILPQKIANRLKSGEQPIADTHECVTILFTDFVGFTKRSSSMQAREIVDFLNEVFLEFDTVVELLALEKIKTIGDAFFMAGGLDPHVTDHALRVVEAGLMFFDALDEHNKRHPHRVPLQMRLGVHSGPVVAGVIGIKKVAYDLWGDSVEIANAMESTGVPGFVHISETTAAFVKGLFRLAPRGELPREKEHIPDNMPKTFLVVGRELPTPYMHLRRPRLMPTNLGESKSE